MGYTNPADAAMPYLDKIPGTITPYYDPYVNSGRDSLGTLQEQYNKLIQNPGAMLNSFGQGYDQSPGYNLEYNQGMNAINNAAASGGFLGTSGHQEQAGALASGLAGQDFYKYLSHILGLYGQGLEGEGQLNQQGYNASTGLAENLGSNLSQQGNLAYQGQANENASRSNLIKSLIEGGVGLLTAAPTGGTSLLGTAAKAIF